MKYATYEENLKFVLEHNIKGLLAQETETIIISNKAEERATVETTDNSELTRLKKLLKANPAEWRLEDFTVSGSDAEVLTSVVASFPKNLLSLRTATLKIDMTEEQRAKIKENLKKAHAAKKNR